MATTVSDSSPVFQIQRIYVKDLSLEQPNSPQILFEQAQPQVDINLGLNAAPVAEGLYEVSVTATVTTKAGDKTLFLVEAKQAGIFELRNIPAEQLRMHLCWGNYPGPHTCDVALGEIADIVWSARPQTVLIEGANPRHAH